MASDAGARPPSPLALATTGNVRDRANVAADERLAQPVHRGRHQRRVERAAHLERHHPLGAARLAAFAGAVTAAGSPEITVWSGALRLAATAIAAVARRLGAGGLDLGGRRDRAPRPSRRAAPARRRASARRAGGPAVPRPRPSACARRRGRCTRRGCARPRPRSVRAGPPTTARTAALCARIAGWALCVSVSSSSGPSHMMRESGTPSVSSIAPKVSRAAGKRSARSFPMPTRLRSLARAHQHRHHRTTALPQVKPAPNATSSTSEPGPMRPSADRLVERERDRRGGGVAVAVDVDHHLRHRDARVLRRGLDDPEVGLVRHQQVDLVRGHAGAGQRLVAGLGHREHRGLEHLAAGHLHEVGAIADHLLADGIGGAAARTVEQRREPAVGLEEGGQEPAAGLARRGAPPRRRRRRRTGSRWTGP